VFASSIGNYLVPSIHAVCKSSKRLAAAADKALDSRDFEKTNGCVSLLQDSFSKAFNDRRELVAGAPYSEEGSKKAGALGIVNELFSIYFVLNTLRLCTNLIKPVEQKKLHMQGTMAEMVTYRYFAGRLCLFEDNFEAAEIHLDYALVKCHKAALQNKRCILRYLIPVKIFRGLLPSSQCKANAFILVTTNLIMFCSASKVRSLRVCRAIR
jgi:nuclear mRNA export protein PCID2/THP1